MRIAYIYQSGRLARLPGVRTGEVPTEFFYGAPELEARGHVVRYLEVHDIPGEGWLRIAAELLVGRKVLPAKVYFSLLYGVRDLLPELRDMDVIVATTPGIAFSLTLLKSWRPGGVSIPAEIVAIHCGVLNYHHNRLRLMVSRWLLKRMWTLLYGVGELAAMKTVFRIPSHRIQVNCFGVDESYWTPAGQGGDNSYILSVGNDSNRDYEGLLQAAESLTKPIKVVTRRQLPENLPNNVEHIHGSWHSQALDDRDLRDLYRQAFCVVVPLKNSIQPSGQSVTLQAMSCGTPVILTLTDGLWETSGLCHAENILLVKPGEPEEIVDAVQLLASDHQFRRKLGSSGRAYVVQQGRIMQFADRMEAMCLQTTDLPGEM